MQQKGYIKLWRKSLESVVWENPNTWKVWSYCLMRANHTIANIMFDGEEVTLQPGQFITGRNQGSKDCKMNPSTFRDQIAKLKKLKNIDITSDNKKSVITIVKWGSYQDKDVNPDTTSDNNPTTTRHRQECKNEKNKKSFQGGKNETRNLTDDEPAWK